MKVNCWEHKRCGRGPGAVLADGRRICPAARERRLDAVHGGVNGGRACWVVAGTFCEGEEPQGTFARKIDTCASCDFYERVRAEEHPEFRLAPNLLRLLGERVPTH